MANVPGDLLYTAEHEYIRDRGNGIVEVGITDYAQGELGDVVYLELPKVGTSFAKHDVFGTIEAVKAVSELFAPIAGEITEVNSKLDGEPAIVNNDPFGEGWMIRLKVKDPAELATLLKPDAYSAQIG